MPKNYIAGVFDRGKSNVIRQDPFDYTMNKDMIFSVNDRNENLGKISNKNQLIIVLLIQFYLFSYLN